MNVSVHHDDNDNHNDQSSARFNFALFPNESLQIHLLTNVKNPHSVMVDCDCDYKNNNDDRIALLNAKHIVGMVHIGSAALQALIRCQGRSQGKGKGATTEHDDDNDDANGGKPTSSTSSSRNARGVALETVLCAGGSAHAETVLRDFGFGFQQQQKQQQGEGTQITERAQTGGLGTATISKNNEEENKDQHENYAVILLAFNGPSESEKIGRLVNRIGGRKTPLTYLSRQRTDQEIGEILKIFKLTKEELEISTTLEHAVVTRITTKFIT